MIWALLFDALWLSAKSVISFEINEALSRLLSIDISYDSYSIFSNKNIPLPLFLILPYKITNT